jgi:hypothetical protein
MTEYYVFDDEGNITGYSTNFGDHEVVSNIDFNTHYLFNNVLTPYSSIEATIKSSIPSYPAKWSNKLMKWVDLRPATWAWDSIRSKRNQLLAQTDWVVARAYERAEPVPKNYIDYRQALRDITNQADPYNITWPILENAQ